MKALNLVTLTLIIVGGICLNWGLIGLSALYQLVPLMRAINVGEVRAQAAHL